MLNINNKDDVNKMMQYHRTRDMITLLKYFPDVSPVRNLTIVFSYEDYLNNYDFCSKLCGERNDSLITEKVMKSFSNRGLNQDIKAIFKDVKKENKNGVLVLFDLINEPSERYDRYAGISIGVSVSKYIYIDAVGKGFDGMEVSKGIDLHEQYIIPWHEIPFLNLSNFHDYQTYNISDDKYELSRKRRIEFLLSIGLRYDNIIKKVPQKYEKIPNFIWQDVLINIIKKLPKMEDIFISDNLLEFAISGHTEGKRFRPWQLYDKTRYLN